MKIYTSRMRERRRERKRVAATARGYEAAGDLAMQRFAYIEASIQFERVLTAGKHSVEDEVRLCEKIGRSIFFSARPDLATHWYERALEQCAAHASLQKNAPWLMLHLPLQRWLESHTTEAPAIIKRARELALMFGDDTMVQRADMLLTDYLISLGRYNDAATRFSSGPTLDTQDPHIVDKYPQLCTELKQQRAIIYATQGVAEAAFANFDHAVDFSKRLTDGYMMTIIWDDYANWAMALGRIDIARACRERALLVARERRIAWRIPYLTLRFASLLITVGDYDHARDLVVDAMTYDTEIPVLRVLRATVGVALAQALNDAELLHRTFDEEALEYAFRSGEAQRIAAIVAAYAKMQIARGNLRRVRTLIANGVAAIQQADHAGDLLALAARYGSSADASRARQLLLERLRLPHHRVTQAYLALWEAYDALRQHKDEEAKEHAEQAARFFGRLGWRHQRDHAVTIIGTRRHASTGSSSHESVPQQAATLSDLSPALTDREQQVAELVLRGLTNRAIAHVLSISEHTVETHMTSILNRLGLRSRWQLRDLAH